MDALRGIISELLEALVPLIDAAHDPDGLESLLKDLGWTPALAVNVPPKLSQAGSALLRFYNTEEELSIIELVDAIKSFVDAINEIRNLSDDAFPAGIDVPVFKLHIARELVDYTIVKHLLQNRHKVGSVLQLAGIIRETAMPASGLRTAYLNREVMWKRVGSLFTDPAQGFREAFAWDSVTPKLSEVIGVIASLLESYDLQLFYFEAENDLLTYINTGAIVPLDNPLGFDIAFDMLRGAPDGVSAGVKIILMPPTTSRGTAIAFFPYALLNGVKEIPLDDRIVLSIGGNADFTKGVSIVLSPGHAPEANTGFLGGSISIPAEAQIGIKVIPPINEPDRLLIGTADATRVTIKEAGFSFGVQVGTSNELDVFVIAELEDARVVIKPAQDEADSFLASFLGSDGLSAQLSLELRLSRLNGFHLTGSGGLEASFPIHITLGPIDFQALSIGLRPTAQGVDLNVGATLAGNLGPLTAIVEGMGFKIKAQFPDPPTGNLGPVDLGFGFKPPNGVGLAIDAGAVKGGGFLRFDPDKEEYDGMLELDLSGIVSVKAIGLITTRMPDGSKGFSLLLIITAEFGSPIQLGLGFTLSGVGGLLGLNRTMRLEVIATGIRDGGINSIMFPQNVVENAPRIISDLKKYFPVEEGTFLIGPMLKIGWGTPNLITVSLGIIIEIPGNIAILGVLKIVLPDEDAALIIIQVNFMGAIEFDKSRLWFFAAIFESRILYITLEGEMGLLVGWGDEPAFVVSVGGFHPAFNPPPLPFGAIARIAISILNTDFARIRITGYFAVTSNSVQFGAAVEIFFGVSAFNIDGHLAFDALFRFSPFYFIITISASLSVKVFGVGLFSVHFNGSLEGPTPWHVEGTGSISLLFFDIDVDFSHTWGNEAETTLPPIAVMPLLEAEFQKLENWLPVIPAGNRLLVSIRTIESGTTDLILHPLGSLKISQRAVPLGLTIDKVGNQKPSDANNFNVTLTGFDERGDAKESFAIGQYLAKSDSELLSAKSFEPIKGGVEVSVSGEQYRAPLAVKRVVRYEKIMIDTYFKRFVKKHFPWIGTLFSLFLNGNATALSSISNKREKQLKPFEDRVQIGSTLYVVASSEDNSPYGEDAVGFTSHAQAQEFLRQQIAADGSLAKQLHVIPQVEMQRTE